LNSVAFSPGGGLLATGDAQDNNVSVFSVAADGALSAVEGSPFATGVCACWVAFGPVDGLLASANYNSGNVSVFAPLPLVIGKTADRGVVNPGEAL
jgi:6-phosphogluconolactonase (cycloisomerase 2 family)